MAVEVGEQPPAAGQRAEPKVTAASPAIMDSPPIVDLKNKIGNIKIVDRKENASKTPPAEDDAPAAVNKKQWNTKNMGSRVMVDASSAATAGGLVAPLITMIDKAIIENASGKRPLMASLKASFTHFLFQPHRFLTSKPFALIFMLYSGTYMTANSLDTFRSTTQSRPASTVTHGTAKFGATSTANLSLCLYKDSQFTKMFGTVSARPVPNVSYFLFAIRDSLTIFASFNLPPMIAPALPLGDAAEKYISRLSAAQFLAPAGIQLLSTPLHLLGLDFYNRNGGTPMRDRMSKVRVDWIKSSLARMCRIVPAFGVGGVVNTSLRSRGMKSLE